MHPDISSSRGTALRPTVVVLAGLVVVAAVAGVILYDRSGAPPPIAAPSGQVPTAKSATSTAAPTALQQPEKPSFDVVRIDPHGQAVMAGHATPGTEVIISDGSKEIGHAQADQHGDWVLVPATPLPPGARELILAERAPNGTETKGDHSVVLVVPETSAAAAPSGEAATPPLAVLTGPNAAPVVLTGPGPAAGGAAPDHAQLGLGAVEYDEHGQIRLSGTAPPAATVRLYVDNRPIGQATADATGRWSFSAGDAVSLGTHDLRLDQIAPDGKVAFRLDRPFARDQLAGAAMAPGHMAIQPGQNLWTIARGTYGHGTLYTVIYQANRQAIRDPNLIYPGQVFALPPPPAIPASSSISR